MIGIIIALSVMLVVMIVFLVLQKIETAQLKSELQEIIKNESNQKIHRRIGVIDREMVNEVNKMLDLVNRTRIDYNRKNHEIEQMMTNISHDLRTPLTSALGYIDMVLDSKMSDDEKDEALRIIERRLIRLKELIDSFFEFSMVISKNEKPEMKEVNLVAVLQESIAHYYDDYCERAREIEFSCKSNKILLNSNVNMMMRIFDNLITNSLKHGQGNLIIKVEEKGTDMVSEEIRISFTNRIEEQDLDVSRLFDEFYTTDISRTKGNTGLGLAIVKQFSQIIGWSISAEEKEGNLSINLKAESNGEREC